jgi:hypothetical protein
MQTQRRGHGLPVQQSEMMARRLSLSSSSCATATGEVAGIRVEVPEHMRGTTRFSMLVGDWARDIRMYFSFYHKVPRHKLDGLWWHHRRQHRLQPNDSFQS